MIDTAWQTANTFASHRTWLGEAQPIQVEHDDWRSAVQWGSDIDVAITGLRAGNPSVDGLFRLAEGDGLAITPVWVDDNGSVIHPLMEMSLVTDDTDWIMLCATGCWRASFTAEMVIDPLSPSSYDCHTTPTWTIYITAH